VRFHAPTGQFTVEAERLKFAATCFRHALCAIRELAGLPLTRYERNGALTSADHAQRAVIEGAESVGIDLGGRYGNEIDVSDCR
jgi:hypothetical protein